jgi:hypothetical protein
LSDETLGLIRSYFPNTEKLTHRIYHAKGIEIKVHPFGLNAEQLEPRAIKAVKDTQKIVDEQYSKPIDELVTYIETEIDKETR